MHLVPKETSNNLQKHKLEKIWHLPTFVDNRKGWNILCLFGCPPLIVVQCILRRVGCPSLDCTVYSILRRFGCPPLIIVHCILRRFGCPPLIVVQCILRRFGCPPLIVVQCILRRVGCPPLDCTVYTIYSAAWDEVNIGRWKCNLPDTVNSTVDLTIKKWKCFWIIKEAKMYCM